MALSDLIPGVSQLKLIAIAGGVIASGLIGAFIDHKFMTGAVASAHLETANVTADYKAYEASTAANAARATSLALDQQTALQGHVNALQAQLQETQRLADVKSKTLQALLASAKPGDSRPIGPVAGSYYERLRGP